VRELVKIENLKGYADSSIAWSPLMDRWRGGARRREINTLALQVVGWHVCS